MQTRNSNGINNAHYMLSTTCHHIILKEKSCAATSKSIISSSSDLSRTSLLSSAKERQTSKEQFLRQKIKEDLGCFPLDFGS